MKRRSAPVTISPTGPGKRGKSSEALRLFRQLLPDLERVAGARPSRHAHHSQQHRLLDRGNGGGRRGAAPVPATAADQERVLGHDHPDTLKTRSNIASWTGETGEEGRRCACPATAADQERVLGHDHPDTLNTRGNIAIWTGKRGRGRGAAPVPATAARPGAGAGARPSAHAHHPRQHRQLDRETGDEARRCACPATAARPGAGARARPSGHAHNPQQHRHWTGETGEGGEALRLFRRLLPTRSGCWGPTIRNAHHPQQHRRLDRTNRRPGRGAAPFRATAPRSDRGARAPTSRHPDHPHRHRPRDEPLPVLPRRRRSSARCSRTRSKTADPPHPSTAAPRVPSTIRERRPMAEVVFVHGIGQRQLDSGDPIAEACVLSHRGSRGRRRRRQLWRLWGLVRRWCWTGMLDGAGGPMGRCHGRRVDA